MTAQRNYWGEQSSYKHLLYYEKPIHHKYLKKEYWTEYEQVISNIILSCFT